MTREYLRDTSFLRELDEYNNKFYYVKIIVLSMDEKPISSIEGRITKGGSINIDGNSAVRRTCSLSFVALEEDNDLTNVENLLSINKKIKIEIGIKNNFSNKYDDDIFWFPQGIFVIVDPSISNSSSGCQISLTCKDKMALLNGECGGNLPASITFHEYDQILGTVHVDDFPSKPNNYTIYDLGSQRTRGKETSQYWQWNKTEGFFAVVGLSQVDDWPINPKDDTVYDFGRLVTKNGKTSQYWQWDENKGFYVSSDPGNTMSEPNLVYDIIQTLVCNYGGESIDKIIINDVPLEIKQLVRNASSGSIFYNPSTGKYSIDQSLTVDASGDWIEFEPGEDCGYVYADFVYPGELVSNIGDNICSVLDKIKNTLGNYEYFYDIDGNFVFQEIKNYLNVSYTPVTMGKLTIPLICSSKIFEDNLSGIDQFSSNQERINYIIDAINSDNLTFSEGAVIKDQELEVDEKEIDIDDFDNGKVTFVKTNYLIDNEKLIINRNYRKGSISLKTENNYNITYPAVEGGYKKFTISYITKSSAWERVNNLYIINQDNYLIDYDSNKKSIYDFDSENNLVISFDNSPNYNNIKNDFHVWGRNDSGLGIHYHLVIKEKPKVMTEYKVVVVNDNQLKIDEDNGISYTPDDWRVEIYLRGKKKESLQQRPDIYEQEMIDLLPMIYEFKEDNGNIIGNYKEDVSKVNTLNYFVDYLDPINNLYDCSVDLIGSRIYSYQQDNIIKLYNNDVPNVIIINKDGDKSYNDQVIERCEREGQPRSNVSGEIYDNMALGTLGYSAQEVARDLLYQYTDYNSTISFQAIPIYYLEPNTRITVKDKKTNIFGDYIINSISRPLDGQGTMSISATKALERI